MGYFRQTVVSVSWVSAFRMTSRFLSVIRTVILARLLTPLQFGDFGIATLVLALVEIFTETGINVFLVQQDDDDAIVRYLDTAWVISIVRGIIITLIVFLFSFPVSSFFNNPASKNLILLLAIVPFIRGFINPSEAKFQKQLRFNQEFYFRTLITLVDAIVAITTVYIYRTPAGLIAGLIAGAFTETVISLLYINPRPRFMYHPQQAAVIIGNGKWVTGAGVAAYLTNKGVDISIGRLLSTTSLGIYQMAYKFSLLFVDEIVEMVNRVAFPVYVKIGGDRKRLQTAFLKMFGSLTGSAALLMGGVALFAEPIVSLLLGPNWIDTTKYLRLLSAVGFAVALAAPTNPLFLAVKKQRYLTHVVVVQLIAFIIAIIPVIQSPSLEKIILASLVAIIGSLPLKYFYAYKICTAKT